MLRNPKIRQNCLNESKTSLIPRFNPEKGKNTPWRFLDKRAESITKEIMSGKKFERKEKLDTSPTPPPKSVSP